MLLLKSKDGRLSSTKNISNRSGTAMTTSIDGIPRPLAAGPLKHKCRWMVELDPHVKEPYISTTSITRQYKFDWKEPVTITSSSCIHTNGCIPCQANIVAVTSASGSYVKKYQQKLFGHYAILLTKG